MADTTGPNLLLSYWYFKNVDLDEAFGAWAPKPNLFADSGAYSAMTQGAPITVAEYAAWVKRWRHWFVQVSNLDVIRNPRKTWNNQRQLEDMGIEALPVFHAGEPWSWFERYCGTYDYLALGGIAGVRASLIKGWVAKCFAEAPPGVVFHGFGVTNWELLKLFRFYSVDSSSWGQGYRYGSVSIFDSTKGRIFRGNIRDPGQWRRLRSILSFYGMDPEDFSDAERHTRKKLAALGAASFIEAGKWLQRYHGPIDAPRSMDNKGLVLYLADSEVSNLRLARNGCEIAAAPPAKRRELARLLLE